MSISPIPLSSLKKGNQSKSRVNNFQYELYECAQLLSVKSAIKDTENPNLGLHNIFHSSLYSLFFI